MNTNLWIGICSVTFILLTAALITLFKLLKILNRARIERSLFFNKSSEFIIILDEELAITKISDSVLRRFNLKTEELTGQPIAKTALWPENVKDRNEALRAFRKALGGEPGIPITFNYKQTTIDKQNFSLRMNVIAIPTVSGRKQDLVCLGQDTTLEKEARTRLRKKIKVENLIEKITASTISAYSLEGCVPDIIKSAGKLLGAKRGFFLQTDENGDIIWNFRWSKTADPSVQTFWEDLQNTSLKEFTDDTGTISIRDVQNNPGIPEAFRNYNKITGVNSFVSLILGSEDRVASGYAGFSFDEMAPPEDETVSLLLRVLKTAFTGLLQRIEAQRDMALFRQAVDAAGQGIILIDLSGQIIYANRAYTDLTGIKGKSGIHVWEAYPDPLSRKVKMLILPLMESGESWKGELKIKNNDESIIDTIETFQPINFGSGEFSYAVNVITDISRQKRLEEQLRIARNKAEGANRIKGDYLANMSHEIRTPLNAVIGLTYLASQTKLDNKQKEYLEKINTASGSLLRIINDILDLSKIDAGFMKLELLPFSLDEMLDNLADMMSETAWEKGLKLIFTRSPEIPEYWEGDRFRISQVLLNLLGNAVKFTEEGRVILRISSDKRNNLSFSVEDTGIGLSNEQKEKLFKPFIQAEDSTSRKFGGSGLGLSISKQIVELMNGSMKVESEQGKGSCFSFSIPLDRAPRNIIDEMGIEDFPYKGYSAFVISNDSLSGRIHNEALSSLGMEVIHYPGVKEVLENPVDVNFILFDVDNYGKNLKEAIYAVSSENVGHLTLILCGSRSTVELEKLVPPGISVICLPIPYSLKRLKRALSIPVSREEKKDGLHSTLVQGRILLVDDNEINRFVGRELIERSGLDVEVASTGAEAVTACETQRFDMVFMDLNMPQMSGYKAASKIRGNHPDLPVIAMTASAFNDIKANIHDAGFTRYIAKPIEPAKLYKLIAQVLGVPPAALQPDTSVPDESSKKIPDIEGDIEGINTETGLRNILGDKVKYRRMLIQFVENHGNTASDIENALKSGRREEAASIIHSLRGSAGLIGAENLQTLSGEMEELLRGTKPAESVHLRPLLLSVNNLIDDISDALIVNNNEKRIQLFEELEHRIRKSDETLKFFMAGIPDVFSRKTDKRYIDRINNALEQWDYDAALEVLDDWRASVGEMNYT